MGFVWRFFFIIFELTNYNRMKKIYLSFLLLSAAFLKSEAQTFSDNFDSYAANSFLVQSNSAWKTWTNKPGGADDVRVSAVKAKSGSNSLYFSSVSASGGPADIVLPFGGGELTSGTFSMSMWMFVDAQKKAYFNLQEQTTLGIGWSIDVNFDSLGKFNIVNTTAGLLLSGNYNQNEWIKVAMNINLSTNTWDFLINDVSKGTFQNTYRKIASMDIFPTQNSSYYIDDVSYTITPATTSTLNASVTFIDKVLGKLAGQQTTPTVEIKNLGSSLITSAAIDVVYNGNTISKNVSGLNLAANAMTTITMDNSIAIVPGNNVLTANVKQVNGLTDDNTTDNIKTISVNPITPAFGKMVVAEEATGTWCTWCPRGAVWMRNMDEKYKGFFLGIAVHNNDPMENANYDGGLGSISSGYPSAVVDRGIDIDPSAMEPDFIQRVQVAPKGGIKAGAIYTASNRELKVSLTTKFNANVSGNYKLAFVLIEDSVTGSGAGWDQVNAYAGGSRGVMGGFEKLPNPVPASMMVYDHVGRIIYPNFKGLSNAFSSSINVSDSFTHNFTVTLDPSWKLERLHIAGLLIDPSGRIDNGSNTHLNKAIANGFINGTSVLSVNEINIGSNQIKIYPNPSKGIFNLNIFNFMNDKAFVSVYNVEGKLMQTQNILEENTTIDASSWPAGLYIATIQTELGVKQIKLVKE
jgi:hypothetical protein